MRNERFKATKGVFDTKFRMFSERNASDLALSSESKSERDILVEPESKRDISRVFNCIFRSCFTQDRKNKSYAVKLWNLNGQFCSPVLISILPV